VGDVTDTGYVVTDYVVTKLQKIYGVGA
jgi:hypothetical protein